MKYRKLILIDLDGVLNRYRGDFDSDFIPPPKNGTEEFLKTLYRDYAVKIFTTRSRIQTLKWLAQNKLDSYVDDVTNIKEPAFLYIDDRCIQFKGNYAELIDKIENFAPWFNR
ncbi:MAG: HAD family hydrolase [Heliobacteriaceae bacterium]|nr:HAD family hydrolase [Heliobacteriaceae bacterium]